MDAGATVGVVWAIVGVVYSAALTLALQQRAENDRGVSRAAFFICALSLIAGDILTVTLLDFNWKWRVSISGVIGAIAFITLSEGLHAIAPAVAQQPSPTAQPTNNALGSGPVITGTGTTVLSFGQSGGVTAGTYINQAVMPQLHVLSQETQPNSDGSVTTVISVRVVAPFTPGRLHIALQADNLIDVSVMTPPVNGISTLSLNDKMLGANSFRADILGPHGDYSIFARTQKLTPITLDSHF